MFEFQPARSLSEIHQAIILDDVQADSYRVRSESMPAVGGSYFIGRPLRRALVAKARGGKPVPAKFAGILAGGIVPRCEALACAAWLDEPRLLDLLRPCDPPGITVDKLDAALHRHGTSLTEAKRDAHRRGDEVQERTLSRLLAERGTVTAELVEKIVIIHTRIGPGVFRTDRGFRRCYWTATANGITSRRKVGRQRPLSESYRARAVRSATYADHATRSAPLKEEIVRVDQPTESISSTPSRNTSETNIVVRISVAEALDFDRVALALGLSRSTMIREFVRQTILVARAGQAVAA